MPGGRLHPQHAHGHHHVKLQQSRTAIRSSDGSRRHLRHRQWPRRRGRNDRSTMPYLVQSNGFGIFPERCTGAFRCFLFTCMSKPNALLTSMRAFLHHRYVLASGMLRLIPAVPVSRRQRSVAPRQQLTQRLSLDARLRLRLRCPLRTRMCTRTRMLPAPTPRAGASPRTRPPRLLGRPPPRTRHRTRARPRTRRPSSRRRQ